MNKSFYLQATLALLRLPAVVRTERREHSDRMHAPGISVRIDSSGNLQPNSGCVAIECRSDHSEPWSSRTAQPPRIPPLVESVAAVESVGSDTKTVAVAVSQCEAVSVSKTMAVSVPVAHRMDLMAVNMT